MGPMHAEFLRTGKDSRGAFLNENRTEKENGSLFCAGIRPALSPWMPVPGLVTVSGFNPRFGRCFGIANGDPPDENAVNIYKRWRAQNRVYALSVGSPESTYRFRLARS